MKENELDKPFNLNKFGLLNDPILKLYDVLKVIDQSLSLISAKGSHEFEAVISQQLRLIYTKSNSLDNSNNNDKFALFEILKNYKTYDNIVGENLIVYDMKLFPKIKLRHRDYSERINSDNKYYLFTTSSIIEKDCYTFEEFIEQPLLEVTDVNGNKDCKTVIQCIKILANKYFGAHYQVKVKKVELDVIKSADIISQTLGEISSQFILPIITQILKSNGYAEYMNRKEYRHFDIHITERK